MNYWLLDPTGNITALAEGPASKAAADEIMKIEPTCEQVGFISEGIEDCAITLEMTGGEFCGNAAMCAALLAVPDDGKTKVFFKGTGPVEVLIKDGKGTVTMPRPLEITQRHGFPLVRFGGIDHMIIESAPDATAENIRSWCENDALGMMFLEGDKMTPLVYVKGADTLFWESTCASGTCAVGEYLGRPVSLREPAGTLHYEDGKLTGTVKLIKKGRF